MKSLLFLFQYALHPKSVGAVIPSSSFLAKKMVQPINFKEANVIVEFGPGTGVFTQELLKNRKEDTIILLVETNLEFYHLLHKKYGKLKNVILIHGLAERTEEYLKEHNILTVDYVVSGIPFKSLPTDVAREILDVTKRILSNSGKVIAFQYTKQLQQLFTSFFSQVTVEKELRNFPPAYIFQLSKENS